MSMLNTLDENKGFKKILEPWIRKLIREETQNCVRRRAVTVATPPNGVTIGVQEPFDTTIMDAPYYATLNNAKVGDTVIIEWLYGLSNAVAISGGAETATVDEALAMVEKVMSSPRRI